MTVTTTTTNAPTGAATGKATRAELHELHRLIVAALTQRLQAAPSAELLHVARTLLRHNGVTAETEEDFAELRRLYLLLVKRLGEALREEKPSAAAIESARAFLQANGIQKDLGAAVDQATAVQALGSLDLPFKTTH